MGKNINKPEGKTIFIDVDGVVVKHNYHPEEFPDEFLLNTISFLKDCYIQGYKIVLTTSRCFEQTFPVIDKLRDYYGIYIWSFICDLPTGERIVINDHEAGKRNKAIAINPIRNLGVSNE